jgi:hypothetical protein
MTETRLPVLAVEMREATAVSYDIILTDAVSGETLTTDAKHALRGGTYELGGTNRLWLNVTYNYAPHFRRVLDAEKGIRRLYGMTGAASIPVLQQAIAQLADDVDDDYWKATEGNAKAALADLLALAQLRPDGVWDGD